MKGADKLQLPETARYTAEHIWVCQDDAGGLLAGVSDHAQDRLGEVAFVDVPFQGQHVDAGEEFGTIESVKSVSSLYMPVSGEIVEVNPAIEETPELVNADCYGKGWLVRIRPDNGEDVQGLLSADAYRATLA